MSIYSTWWNTDEDEHQDGCGYWIPEHPEAAEAYFFIATASSPAVGDPPVFVRSPDRNCTTPSKCPGAPYVYQGSHILPAAEDARGGAMLVCAIPSFITRDGQDDGTTLHDFLRVSVHEDPATYQPHRHHTTILLTRLQVAELRDTLTAWLERGTEAA